MQAGDVVVLGAAVVGPTGSSVIHDAPPQLGFVESLVAGPPVTNVVVVWQDGRRQQYNAVGSGATALLYVVANIAAPVPIVGFVAQPKAGTGIPNPGTRLQGPIVQQYGLEDALSVVVREVIIVSTPLGVLVMETTDAAVLASA